jgi:hypothetical protein
MVIKGTVAVTCPGCGETSDRELVQSLNPRVNPADIERLLAGELNVLACSCGKHTQLAATLLFHDPDRDFYCQVAPGGDVAMTEAEAAFAAAGASGIKRIVPSQNALVEKLRILDAALEDWAVEMNKVLLLASIGELDRVLLFEAKDAGLIHWILFDEEGRAPERVSSPLASYEKLVAREQGAPKPGDLRIDRAWAVEAVHTMIKDAN